MINMLKQAIAKRLKTNTKSRSKEIKHLSRKIENIKKSQMGILGENIQLPK